MVINHIPFILLYEYRRSNCTNGKVVLVSTSTVSAILSTRCIERNDVVFATAFYIHYDALRGYFPIEDDNNEIEEILVDTAGRFIRKPGTE